MADIADIFKEISMARKRIKFGILTVFALMFVCGASAVLLTGKLWAAADTQKDAKAEAIPEQAGSPWVVRCDDIKEDEKVTGKYCEMVQSISVSQKGADPSTAQRLLEMAIGYPPPAKDNASGVLILPLGILVTDAIVLEIDGKKEKSFPVRYCEAGGCIARFELSKKELEKLIKGQVMIVKTVSASGQPVTIEMSLTGFGDAHAKIKPAN